MKDSLETEIGLAIQSIRRQQHMTRKELAQKAGLTLAFRNFGSFSTWTARKTPFAKKI